MEMPHNVSYGECRHAIQAIVISSFSFRKKSLVTKQVDKPTHTQQRSWFSKFRGQLLGVRKVIRLDYVAKASYDNAHKQYHASIYTGISKYCEVHKASIAQPERLCRVCRGRNVAATTCPVDMDVLALGVLLTGVLRLDQESVSTKVIALRLEQVRWQVLGTVTIEPV